ncbi:MAG: hypothetical protein LLF76_03285 [Planctomycetaceae bacterium]|nr:hypothetical protein [Planctomycetaceae bacterium]
MAVKKVSKKQAAKKATKRTLRKKKMSKKKTSKKKLDGVCFVMMPFKDPFDTYFNEILEPAVKEAGLEPVRGDSVFMSSSIVGDIWRKTQEARVLIADLSEKNANVFYELGLAHAIGKPVILISESMEDVPFDLRNYRVITYDKDNPRWGETLQENIVNFLEATLADPVEAVPSMFRKPVKSQAPTESDTSLRLRALERKVDSIRQRTFHERRISPNEALSALESYMSMNMPISVIVKRLTSKGVPQNWLIRTLEEKYGQRDVRQLEGKKIPSV